MQREDSIKRYDHKKNNSQKTVIEIFNNWLCSDWPGGVTAVVMAGAGVYGEFGVEAAGGVTEILWNQQQPLLQTLHSTNLLFNEKKIKKHIVVYHHN